MQPEGHEVLLAPRAKALPSGFRGYLVQDGEGAEPIADAFVLAPELRYLAHGDVVRVDPPRRSARVLYRRASPSNSFLVTERCDNYCVMCSQPPKDRDDGWLVDELLEIIPLISRETEELGLTGGEPAILGDRLVEVVAQMKEQLPKTAVHILTNGRRFRDRAFAQRLGSLVHPDLMMGIPLYSDLPEEHDHVVQAHGAYEDTIQGILNLKQARVRVELRVVVHALTYARLPQLAQFIARNLLFVDHVALMGLELMGFARSNLDALWIDPLDYGDELAVAVRTLDRARVPVSIYNHQLCVLARELHPWARKSISDWKNVYFDECSNCSAQAACGGFFASSTVRRSRGIAPTTI